MPLQATSGAASYDGFGGGAAAVPAYIEEVFSTYLYTGTAVAQTINNNIDLSTKGGMVWTKNRNYGISHGIVDTARGVLNTLVTNNTDASASYQTVTAFGTTGFSVGTSAIANGVGDSTMVSWTFREQPKFFDVVTYTGNGTAARAISHNLGSTPGCMIVKRTDAAGDWRVYHRGCSTDNGLVLNDTAAQTTSAIYWFGNEVNVIPPTSTQFTVNAGFTNTNGGTYVAYLFAHDAGGFGLTGTDNVISCGSFTGNTTVTLGYEPQWILLKNSGGVEDWYIHDTMRGWPVSGDARVLFPNLSSAESGTAQIFPNATGFTTSIGGGTYIYIAIRRGPMKVPTLGTSVFQPITASSSSTIETTTATFPLDMQFNTFTNSSSATYNSQINDRLRGIGFSPTFSATPHLTTASTSAETTADSYLAFKGNGMDVTKSDGWGAATAVFYNFRRAPGFFDEVCYTGTGSATTQTHNLGAVPELMITKSRSTVYSPAWGVYHAALGNTKYLNFLSSSADVNASYWNNTTPTGSAFTVNSNGAVNASGATYVAYLFATCAGVSKVFSYTGNGSSQTINCGFTGGARFVLIKRTDSTGDWYVWDSARGIVAGNDPHLSLNTTAAEVTTDDSVDTDNTGFIVNQVAATNVNVSSATYIGLAVA